MFCLGNGKMRTCGNADVPVLFRVRHAVVGPRVDRLRYILYARINISYMRSNL